MEAACTPGVAAGAAAAPAPAQPCAGLQGCALVCHGCSMCAETGWQTQINLQGGTLCWGTSPAGVILKLPVPKRCMLLLPAFLQVDRAVTYLPHYVAAHQPVYCPQDEGLQGQVSPGGLKGSLCMLCAGVGGVKEP